MVDADRRLPSGETLTDMYVSIVRRADFVNRRVWSTPAKRGVGEGEKRMPRAKKKGLRCRRPFLRGRQTGNPASRDLEDQREQDDDGNRNPEKPK
ncbi:MAG TPA: hypothetical protein VMP00_16495 [Burkholderiales bacterium]|nr:hypothetical protein [Burkholderiales bacterium]